MGLTPEEEEEDEEESKDEEDDGRDLQKLDKCASINLLERSFSQVRTQWTTTDSLID